MRGALNLLADVGGTFWLPPQASSYSGETDWLFWFVMWISIFFFFLVAALVVIFCWKYRYREGMPVGDAPKHSTSLELTWTFIPTVIMVVIFVYGFKGYMRMTVPPTNTYDVVVYGSMWQWQFQYPNGHQDKELHLPKDLPVQFILSSSDVIHSFAIPAFRMKKDVVPGRYNKSWAEPTAIGEYDIYCDQYCGDQHSLMRAKCFVQSKSDFDDWMNKAVLSDSNLPPVDHGQALYAKKGCNTCHTIDGGAGTGPTWKNVYGHTVEFADGTSLTADENYIRSMIVNPNNKIIRGFSPVMPSFQGQLKDKTHDVDDLIAYIKTLSDTYKGPTTAPATVPAKQTVSGPTK